MSARREVHSHSLTRDRLRDALERHLLRNDPSDRLGPRRTGRQNIKDRSVKSLKKEQHSQPRMTGAFSGRGERFDRLGLVFLDVKHGVELGDLQKIVDVLAQVHQLQLTALVAH